MTQPHVPSPRSAPPAFSIPLDAHDGVRVEVTVGDLTPGAPDPARFGIKVAVPGNRDALGEQAYVDRILRDLGETIADELRKLREARA